MEGLILRTATTGDLPTLLRFEQGVIGAERPFDPTLKRGTIHYYDLEELMASPEAEVVVAEKAGVVIGSGYARIVPAKPYHQHRQYAYLGFMYVEPAYRGQGINKRIVETLVQWSRARQVTEIRLEVYHGNEAAIRAYEKAGFSRHMVEMRMDVPPQQS